MVWGLQFLGLAVLSAHACSSHFEKIELSLAFIAFSMLGWPLVAGYFIESPEHPPGATTRCNTHPLFGFLGYTPSPLKAPRSAVIER